MKNGKFCVAVPDGKNSGAGVAVGTGVGRADAPVVEVAVGDAGSAVGEDWGPIWQPLKKRLAPIRIAVAVNNRN